MPETMIDLTKAKKNCKYCKGTGIVGRDVVKNELIVCRKCFTLMKVSDNANTNS